MRKRFGANGFTLVELMIVVAIIGVLAALAVYGVGRYLRHSKTAEATRSLGSMEQGSKAKFQLDTDTSGPPATGAGPFKHVFCSSAGAAVPASGVPVGKKVVVVSSGTAEYNQPAFTCLKFLMTDAQYYQYNYTSNAPTAGTAAFYTATAIGDLDGNGVQSTYSLKGNGNAVGEASRVSLTVVNEDE